MSHAAIETLLHPIKSGDIDGKKIAFLNALMHADMSVFSKSDMILQQHFKPYVDELISSGFAVSPDIPSDDKSYDLVCILMPKNMIEARYFLARAAGLLKDGCVLICAADNKAGGSRIKKLMQDLGFEDLYGDARNKARVVWGCANNLDKSKIEHAIDEGQECAVLDGEFISQAGIFGWNKIDKGSQILSKYIPADLKGKGADFGCGYGYLSRLILSNCKKVKQLYCIDADYRAVNLCEKNLAEFESNKEFLWHDLTKPQDSLRNLDFIIMNPPFHDGKKTDISIGRNFIDQAHKALRRNGRLIMVANNHLDYERVLNDQFFEYSKLYEGQGFKVFCALK